MHPFTLAAKANTEDYPTLREVLRMPREEQDGWFDSMKEEMDSLLSKECFELVDRASVEADGHKIIPTTWALRMKRRPDGTPYRKKSRMCLRGDLQTDIISRNDVYAPVVDWATVRLLFGLSVHQDYVTKQVDFRLAFIQADNKEDVYAELPPGAACSPLPMP